MWLSRSPHARKVRDKAIEDGWMEDNAILSCYNKKSKDFDERIMHVVFFCHSFKQISFLFIAANVKVPSKAQLNKRNGKGETLLHKACRKDDLAQVRVLIQAGISINMEDYAGPSQFVCALRPPYSDAFYLRLKRIYCPTLNRPNSQC